MHTTLNGSEKNTKKYGKNNNSLIPDFARFSRISRYELFINGQNSSCNQGCTGTVLANGTE
jgi:hypothetical protein